MPIHNPQVFDSAAGGISYTVPDEPNRVLFVVFRQYGDMGPDPEYDPVLR